MAPPKSKKLDGEEKGKAVATKTTSTRVTRSMDRKTRSQTQGTGSSSKLMNFESPEKRKRKNTSKKTGETKKVKKEEEAPVQVEEKEEATEDHVSEQEEEEEKEPEIKKIIIEHCKQCQSFKKRAEQVKKGLKKAVPGIIVTVNAEKPRRGCFEIREEGGETFISLLEMERPFTLMKELDMDQVIADIIEKIK